MLYWYKSTCFTGTKVLISEEDLEVGECFKQLDLSLLALLVQSTCFTGTNALTSEEYLEVGECFKQMDLNHDGVLSKQVYLIYYPIY